MMSFTTDEFRVLHIHYVTLPQLHLAQLHLVKSSSYPFMKIHGTTFMEILHRMDQMWCDGDLNNSGSIFHNVFV
jgi:hypothetical protein